MKKKKKAHQFLASREKEKPTWGQITPFLYKIGGWREDLGGRFSCLSQNITNFSFPLPKECMLFTWMALWSSLTEGKVSS